MQNLSILKKYVNAIKKLYLLTRGQRILFIIISSSFLQNNDQSENSNPKRVAPGTDNMGLLGGPVFT